MQQIVAARPPIGRWTRNLSHDSRVLRATCRPPTAFGVPREESVVPFVHRRSILLLAAGAAATLVGPGLPVASGQAAAEQNPAAELIKRTAGRVLDLVMTK